MLESAYRATTYVASGPAGSEIQIRVDQNHVALDGLLREYGVTSWAFLTPCNPRSEPLSNEKNAARLSAMSVELEVQCCPLWNGAGVGAGRDWPPEPSLLVLGISRSDATELACRYGQYAFIFGQRGGCAELGWTPVAPTAG